MKTFCRFICDSDHNDYYNMFLRKCELGTSQGQWETLEDIGTQWNTVEDSERQWGTMGDSGRLMLAIRRET